VTALYNNSEECGESEPSNTVDVSLVNHPPPAVMLLQPDDGTTITVTESNSGDDFPFIWTAVNDEDNDPVMYVVSATDETGAVHDTAMAVAGWFPTIGQLAAPLLEDSVAVMIYSWNVYASDPWDSTASSNGPRSLTIDVSGLLALNGIGLPDVFALHNNYPNPFNPVTNITYDIPEVAQVTLEIYNVSGQKVRTLAQGQHEPGRYRIQWNATNDYGNPLSSGMYIYRIHAGDFVSVKKLILMK
jgi:predicted TIM-barrel fold metal-dependent hydrolase